MCKRYLLTGIVFLWGIAGFSQTSHSLPEADAATFRLYNERNWKALIETGTKAIGAGMDFYYLRVRLGIAYYETGNFHRAITHLEKANMDGNGDAFVQESLFYAYLMAGRRMEALVLSKSFTPEQQLRTGTDKMKIFRQVDVYLNANKADNSEVIASFSPDDIPEEDGRQYISLRHRYFFAGLRHEFSPSFSFYHAYTGLQKDHFVYAREEDISTTNEKAGSALNQYFASAQLRVARNVQVLGGMHLVGLKYVTPIVTQRQGRDVLSWENGTTSESVFFGGISAQAPFVSGLAMLYSGNLNKRKQFQADLQLTFYPLGNYALYLVSQLSHQTEKLDAEKVNRLIFDQQIGFKLAPKWWTEGYVSFGDMQNFVANQGAVLFNTMDLVKNRAGLRVHFFPTIRTRLQLEGTWFKNQSNYHPKGSIERSYHPIYFNSYSITGGLSWYF
jgi:tetratricopeptide (TPR) repeat protein